MKSGVSESGAPAEVQNRPGGGINIPNQYILPSNATGTMKTLLTYILPGQAEQILHLLPHCTHGSHALHARRPHVPSSPYGGVICLLLHCAIMHARHCLCSHGLVFHFFIVMYLISFPCIGPLV
jgi:hypothetical protein